MLLQMQFEGGVAFYALTKQTYNLDWIYWRTWCSSYSLSLSTVCRSGWLLLRYCECNSKNSTSYVYGNRIYYFVVLVQLSFGLVGQLPLRSSLNDLCENIYCCCCFFFLVYQYSFCYSVVQFITLKSALSVLRACCVFDLGVLCFIGSHSENWQICTNASVWFFFAS